MRPTAPDASTARLPFVLVGLLYGFSRVGAAEVRAPFVLRLFVELPNGLGTGLCGATLVGPSVAVTAAHCVEFDGRASPFLLVQHPETGAHSRALPQAPAPGRDVVAIRLLRPFFDPIARFAPLPLDGGKFGYFFGLEPVVFPLNAAAETGEYSLALGGARSVPVNYTCRGDSGAPLLDEDGRVAGLLSRGEPMCGNGGFLRYAAVAQTDVTAYISGVARARCMVGPTVAIAVALAAWFRRTTPG